MKNGNVILGRRAFPKFLSTPFAFCHTEVRKLLSSPRAESEHFLKTTRGRKLLARRKETGTHHDRTDGVLCERGTGKGNLKKYIN